MRSQPWYDYASIVARPASAWPNGRRLAVYVAVGVEEYSFGEGMTESLLSGAPHPDLANTAWRDYGNRVGGFRLIERLSGFGIRPTILLNTAVYESAPALTDFARGKGAEFVAHGIANSDTMATMAPEEERRYVEAARDAIALREGAPPRGWSSPWLAHSATTLSNLAGAGYDYLLDLRLDDQPAWLEAGPRPILSIPYALELNDSSTMIGRQASAADFTAMIVDEFDELLAASRESALVMSIVLHSFISGQPFRLKAVTRALDHICRARDEVWFCTPRDIADAAAANSDLVAMRQHRSCQMAWSASS